MTDADFTVDGVITTLRTSDAAPAIQFLKDLAEQLRPGNSLSKLRTPELASAIAKYYIRETLPIPENAAQYPRRTDNMPAFTIALGDCLRVVCANNKSNLTEALKVAIEAARSRDRREISQRMQAQRLTQYITEACPEKISDNEHGVSVMLIAKRGLSDSSGSVRAAAVKTADLCQRLRCEKANPVWELIRDKLADISHKVREAALLAAFTNIMLEPNAFPAADAETLRIMGRRGRWRQRAERPDPKAVCRGLAQQAYAAWVHHTKVPDNIPDDLPQSDADIIAMLRGNSSLPDKADSLLKIAHDLYPGGRLIASRTPALATALVVSYLAPGTEGLDTPNGKRFADALKYCLTGVIRHNFKARGEAMKELRSNARRNHITQALRAQELTRHLLHHVPEACKSVGSNSPGGNTVATTVMRNDTDVNVLTAAVATAQVCIRQRGETAAGIMRGLTSALDHWAPDARNVVLQGINTAIWHDHSLATAELAGVVRGLAQREGGAAADVTTEGGAAACGKAACGETARGVLGTMLHVCPALADADPGLAQAAGPALADEADLDGGDLDVEEEEEKE